MWYALKYKREKVRRIEVKAERLSGAS